MAKKETLTMDVFRMGDVHRKSEHRDTERLVKRIWDAIEEGESSECVANALVNVLSQLICSHGADPVKMAKIFGQALKAFVVANLEMKDKGDERSDH